MKYSIGATIPTGRQYENIKISYETDKPEEFAVAKNSVCVDIDKYYHFKREEKTATPLAWKEGDRCILSGIKWVVKDGRWITENVKADTGG